MTTEPLIGVHTVVGDLFLPRDDVVITRTLVSCGEWAPSETTYFRSVLQEGQCFVDVGAHVGYFTILAATCVGESGLVYAIEPEARNLALLQRNIERNEVNNVVVFPFAANATPGRMSLALEEQNRGAHHLVSLGSTSISVRCVRLDDVLPEHVDIIKIDAQGFDHDIISGLQRTIERNREILILCEFSQFELARRGIDGSTILAHYVDLGFTLSIFDSLGRLRVVSLETMVAMHDNDLLEVDGSIVLSFSLPPMHFSPDRVAFPLTAMHLGLKEQSEGILVTDFLKNRAHNLNHTAAGVFSLCTGDNSVTAIAAALAKAFDLPSSPLTAVTSCIDEFRSEGLIE